MRLVPKLTLAFVGGMSVILAGNAYLRIRREVAFFDEERVRDHMLIGTALGTAVSAIWKLEGGWRAMTVIEQANQREGKVHIRWTPSSGFPTLGSQEEAGRLGAGEPITRTTRDAHGDGTRSTFVPISLDANILGALEIYESLSSEQAYARKIIVDTVVTALMLAFVCATLAMALNVWLVGRPVESLAAKAQRVGRGDFSSPIDLRGADELVELGREMNAMCERLTRTVDQLHHADRLATVGMLSSGLAHELGTPLNVISARAEMIASGEAGPEASDYARVILQASERMAGIVRQLLEFARRKRVQKAPHDLRQLSDRAIRLLQPIIDKRQIAVRTLYQEGTVVTEVDAVQFQQVLTNFIMNAVQASPDSSTIDVAIAVEHVTPPVDHEGSEGSYVRVSVEDRGVGMTPEHLKHIFEPFFTTKPVGEGTGLGLSVAYGIVRDHGGWIAVDSQPGRGSRFAMLLPNGTRT